LKLKTIYLDNLDVFLKVYNCNEKIQLITFSDNLLDDIQKERYEIYNVIDEDGNKDYVFLKIDNLSKKTRKLVTIY